MGQSIIGYVDACPVRVGDGTEDDPLRTCGAKLQVTVERQTWYDAPKLDIIMYDGDPEKGLSFSFDPDAWTERGGDTTGDRYYCEQDHDEGEIVEALQEIMRKVRAANH